MIAENTNDKIVLIGIILFLCFVDVGFYAESTHTEIHPTLNGDYTCDIEVINVDGRYSYTLWYSVPESGEMKVVYTNGDSYECEYSQGVNSISYEKDKYLWVSYVEFYDSQYHIWRH